MPQPRMLPLQSSSEKASTSNSPTACISAETSSSMANESPDAETTQNRPFIGPGIVQPFDLGSSVNSEEDSTSNSSTAYIAAETKTNLENEGNNDEGTAPKRRRLGPGLVQPLGSGSSIFTEISPTHEQWRFNALLISLAKQIDDNDFRQMKEMYKGGIPRGILCSIKEPMELFDAMQKRYFLTQMNLLQLQGLLWSIEKPKLMDMVINYARQSENTAYLQPASATPVNGYTHVKFHLHGKQFGKMTKKEICYLRAVAANVVLIPAEYVLIDGIDPSSSVVVTMQFPEQHANIFRKMLKGRELELGELIQFGVDAITIGDTTFQIIEIPEENLCCFTDEEVDVSIKLQWAEKKITNLEVENKKQSDKIDELDKLVFTLQTQNDTFTNACKTKDGILSEDKMNQEDVLSLAKDVQGALTRFTTALEVIAKENFKRHNIVQLLQAHATLIASVCYQDTFSIMLKYISAQDRQTQSQMITTGLHGALQQFIGEDLSEESAPIKALKEISLQIRPDEVHELENVNNLTESERNEIISGSRPILLVLASRESDRRGLDFNLEEFLTKCLMIIHRPDLLQEFHEKLAKYATDDRERSDGTPATDTQAEAKTSREPHINDIASNVENILVKLSEIDKKLNNLPELGKPDSELKGYQTLYIKLMERSKSTLMFN